MANRALPDLTSRIQIETSSLGQTETKAKSFTANLAASFGASTKSAEQFEQGLKRAVSVTGETGEATESLLGKLDNLSGLAGLGGVGIAALGVTGVLGGLTLGVEKSLESYMHFTEEVQNFQRVTGASAEESSKMVDVFQQLGIDGDVASTSMLRMQERLQKLHEASPAVIDTLANLADRYNAAGTAAERDTIAYQAFGKQAASMIPVLEQGSQGLRQMADASGRVITQEDIERVHELNIQMKQLEQENSRLGDSIGRVVAGSWLPLVSALNNSSGTLDVVHSKYRDNINDSHAAAQALHAEQDARKKDAEAAQAQADANKRVEDSLRTLADEQDKMLKSDQSLITSNIAKQRADTGVAEALKRLGDDTLANSEYTDKHKAALDRIATAQAAYTAAVKAHGPTSAAAAQAQDALNTAVDAGKNIEHQYADQAITLQRDQQNVTDAMVSAADAAVTLAEKQADVDGVTLSAAQKADIFRQALQNEMTQLAPDSPLRVALQGYIDQLHNIPSDIETHIGTTISESVIAVKEAEQRQGGGSVIPGHVYTVGEHGPETLVMGSNGGYVVPNGGYTDNRQFNVNVSGASMGQLDEARVAELMRRYERLYA